MNAGKKLQDSLGLKSAPVAITFRASAPANIPHVARAGAAGCSYWKKAAEGHTFYTEAADHYNCPIGAYTHNVDLPAAQMQQLQGVVTTMVTLGYIRSEEVPGIPRRQEPFGVAIYEPLAQVADTPDVVLIRGNARQMMLLEEASIAAGVFGTAPLMGRPTCAAIPLVQATQKGVASLGCIGNRIYTELADDELYCALPGKKVAEVEDKLAAIISANNELAKYHRARLSA
jgi:uncharacterized protein (DUF169 family)